MYYNIAIGSTSSAQRSSSVVKKKSKKGTEEELSSAVEQRVETPMDISEISEEDDNLEHFNYQIPPNLFPDSSIPPVLLPLNPSVLTQHTASPIMYERDDMNVDLSDSATWSANRGDTAAVADVFTNVSCCNMMCIIIIML